MTLRTPPKFNNESLAIDLLGTGCLPEIMITHDESESSKDNANQSINFKRVILGTSVEKRVTMKNIGNVWVHGKMSRNVSDAFMIHESGFDSQSNGDLKFEIAPESSMTFAIKFAPFDVQLFIEKLDVYITDENKVTLELTGESFSDVVIIQGLSVFKPTYEKEKLRKTTSRTSSTSRLLSTPSMRSFNKRNYFLIFIPIFCDKLINDTTVNITEPSVLSYNLNFETCFLNKTKTICFKLISTNELHHLRFQIDNCPNVVFVPSCGHLPPLGSKSITATFLASEAVSYKQVNKIGYDTYLN